MNIAKEILAQLEQTGTLTGTLTLVEWSCANKKIKLMRTLILRRMVVYK